MIEENLFIAFALTSFAGLATMAGAAIAFGAGRRHPKFLSWGLGFSAGVMLYLSFFELLKEGGKEFAKSGEGTTSSVALFFMVGLIFAGIIDFFTHRYVGACENGCFSDKKSSCDGTEKKLLLKAGIFTAAAIALHNFPEGIITFITASYDLQLGTAIAVAIAIHNIPEGFCVALPTYFATGSRKKALWYTAVASIAEPIGAVFAFFFLSQATTPFLMGAMLSSVAGIMSYVAIDELLPTASRNGGWHDALLSLVLGMFLMFVILG
jgi:ZIP family zinc transporter